MNLIEYVVKYHDFSFKEEPFNQVDALVFAQLAYYDYSFIDNNTTFKQLREINDLSPITLTKNLRETDEKLFSAVVNAKRYEDVEICDYLFEFDPDMEKQFAKVNFMISKKKIVVAYRGTDGTIVGWKENFNMTFLPAIPSQLEAAIQLQKVLIKPEIEEAIIVGHSKGGNLATYASARVSEDLQQKISMVYNFDGPGFNSFFLESLGYKNISNRVEKYVPQSSCVGRILLDDKYTVVQSTDEFIMQHWAFTWAIRDNHFVEMPGTDVLSDNVDLTVDDILIDLSKNDRKEIVDLFYEIAQKNNCIYTDDILFNKEQILSFAKNYMNVDFKQRIKLTGFLWRLFFLFIKNYFVGKHNSIQAERSKTKEELEEEKKMLMQTYKDTKSSLNDYMSRINKS